MPRFRFSSAAGALRHGGDVGVRRDRCRCPRRARRQLRQPRLADLFGAAVDGDLAGRATDGAQHDAAGPARQRVAQRRAAANRRSAAASSTGRASSAACSPASSAPACSACCSATASMGGLGGFASMLGLMLQIGIIAHHRLSAVDVVAAPQPAGAGQRSRLARLQCHGSSRSPMAWHTALAVRAGGGSGVPAPRRAPPAPTRSGSRRTTSTAFEQILGEVQTAYSAEDLGRLRRWSRPRWCPTSRRNWPPMPAPA